MRSLAPDRRADGSSPTLRHRRPGARTGRLCPVHIDSEALSWWLFLASAVVFVVAAIRAGDLLFAVGSILFLAGRGRPTRDR